MSNRKNSWMSTRQNIRCKTCGAKFVSDGGGWAHAVTLTDHVLQYQQEDGRWVDG